MSNFVVSVDPYFVTRIAINLKTTDTAMSSSNDIKRGGHLALKRADNYVPKDIDSQLMVCLMNRSAISIQMTDTTDPLTATEVLTKVFNQLNDKNIETENMNFHLTFDAKYKKLFSIWVTSAYLELQLQPTHRPFQVLASWDQLLLNHGPIEIVTQPELIRKDEPNLSFQRNVFCDKSIEDDIQVADIGALWLLYFEAKLNVLDGRYPYEDYEQLAAIQAAIDLGAYDANKYSVQYFKQHLNEYIPCNHLKMHGLMRTLSLGSKSSSCAQKITDKYRQISENKSSEYDLLRRYLHICHTIPVYGSAYFSAQIERPITSRVASLMSHFDLKVWVAVNKDGLHLISKEKPELLLSIDYNDLCWAVGRPQDSSDPNCIPCLFIQIPDEINENNTILQIFSRQYRHIEQLLNSFIDDAKKLLRGSMPPTPSGDVTDGPVGGQPLAQSVTTSRYSLGPHSTLNRKKLSLATFDNSGQCINKTGSWVKSQYRRTIT